MYNFDIICFVIPPNVGPVKSFDHIGHKSLTDFPYRHLGPPGVLGSWGEAGEQANCFGEAVEQAHTFGDLWSTAKKKNK